jgi:uncharacterized oxidoreductase
MDQGTRVCAPEPLRTFVAGVCRALGADAASADEVARHLVRANLSGHDSHGVIRVMQYVAEADRGELRPAAKPRLLRETPVTAVVDAGRGFGQVSTAFALAWAMERARDHGLAAAVVRHSMHIGRVGEYTERAAQAGLIALVTVGAAGPGVDGVVIYGGRAPFFGTNPWSVGVPGRERAMVFDGATSMIAEGKIRVARAAGKQLPPGCIVDASGRPTQDPDAFYAGGLLLPLGGEVAGHKGYGLALSSALLGALAIIDDPEPTLAAARVTRPDAPAAGRVGGVFLCVVDPAGFGDADRYRALVDGTLAAAKAQPPAPGRDEVLLPGEPEALSRRRREVEGIPIPDRTWRDLEEVARRFGLPMPDARVVPG